MKIAKSIDHYYSYFLSRTITDEAGCMIWQGSTQPNGYGKVGLNGRTILVHRFIALKEKAFDPPVDVIMHLCNNPTCINPEHLMIGTQSENNLMSYDNGRKRGVDHPFCKLSECDVIDIRKLYASGQYTQYKLADAYGVNQSIISRIVNYKKRDRVQ